MTKDYNRANVAHINGTIRGHDNIIEAQAININADILKNVLDRLDILETGIKAYIAEQERKK